MIMDKKLWSELVGRIFFLSSVCDRKRESEKAKVLTSDFFCAVCPEHPKFATRQGLLQHSRTKHGLRIPARLFVTAEGTCPFCGTQFKQRLRCIAHLSDARRGCFSKMACATPILSEAEAAVLDEVDRKARLLARRAGHRHPIAVGSALTSSGKRVGFAQT